MEKPRSDEVTTLQGLVYEPTDTSGHVERSAPFPYVPFSALSGRRERAQPDETDFAPLSAAEMPSASDLAPDEDLDDSLHEGSERNWNAMLDALKEYVERGEPRAI